MAGNRNKLPVYLSVDNPGAGRVTPDPPPLTSLSLLTIESAAEFGTEIRFILTDQAEVGAWAAWLLTHASKHLVHAE
jgi:hypothetical protein